MTISVDEIYLNTARDFRGLGWDLDVIMKKIINADYGIYSIDASERYLYLIIENMEEFQSVFNKGVEVLGDFGTKKIEIYDKKKRQEIIDNVYLNLNL
ncbi:hypothetical protein DEAC_c02400 [Desulfosporosinus acididurans]|uniref:Uncharacterized protein n=1 Tax=Desulfosporosinus acididurans TaxID=476652 RepID=A0A0J1FXU3_9FIRM|nr:hypothetical protein [Desulfosporosinus acididurans]KLU67833.1 hypothetical protein DEAC_c02400 [Desulfosporosinus acididurans]